MSKHDLIAVSFPSGVKNQQYGVWRSRCCGTEIVLYRDSIFPTCNRHKEQLTEWVLVSTDLLRKPNVVKLAKARSEPDRASAAQHLSPERVKQLDAGAVLLNEIETAHLKTCQVCRSLLQAA